MKDNSGFIVFDMDSTLIRIECIDEIARLNDRYTKVSAITEAAMRGDIGFSESLHQRVACLAGVSETKLNSVFNPIPFQTGAKELVAYLKRLGWKTAVISGGFTWFADKVQQSLALDGSVANHLEVRDGCLTGKLMGAMIDASAKAEHLKQLAHRWDVPLNRTVAVGDGSNDRLMLQAAGVGIAFNAKPALQAVATYSVNSSSLQDILPYLARSKLIEPGL